MAYKGSSNVQKFLYLLHNYSYNHYPAQTAMPRQIPQFPLEITMEILSRLPITPLLRFKSQSRHETTQFSRQGSRRIRFEFVGSCNGLICALLDSDNKIIVWNPTTGESRQLPKPDSVTGDHKILFHGFGYDFRLDDYKLVRAAHSSSTNQLKMEIFNLKENVWRSADNVLHFSYVLEGSPVALNGVLHWLVSQHNSTIYAIYSFDLVEEKYLEIVLVPDHVSKNLGTELKILGASLCVCSSCYPEYFEAWMMNGYGSKACWTKLFSISSEELPGCEDSLHVLWVARNGNVILIMDSCQVVVYNPTKRSSKEFYPDNESCWFDAITYMETIVSPNAHISSIDQ
ncbi:F-box/kelch-repeat protein At3g23880-like [Mercurialis annua]|uniref:F-box/kelch-repeat protein At3g23880-like n=1 Tax=Mercurialis annua TaxID=3986 RepID=UPI0024AED3BD|nr:F-box/kelch-repeat protein At3g23880-like [Mercurialis annua]